MTRRGLFTGIVVTLVLVALAGCGRRGPLESPVASRNQAEQPVPAMLIPAPTPSDSGSTQNASRTDVPPAPPATAAGASDWQDGQASRDVLARPKAKTSDPKPKRAFFLDPLLN